MYMSITKELNEVAQRDYHTIYQKAQLFSAKAAQFSYWGFGRIYFIDFLYELHNETSKLKHNTW